MTIITTTIIAIETMLKKYKDPSNVRIATDRSNVRIAKLKNIFERCYLPNWPEEVFKIKKVKNTLR